MKKRQESFRGILLAMMGLLIVICPQRGEAKRPVPEVKPVEVNGYRFTAPHNEMGVVEVYEIKTGKKRWDMRVYNVKTDPDLEMEERGAFIKELRHIDEYLVVVDEEGQEFPVPLELSDAWGGEGYDGGFRYRLFFARYKFDFLELWIDAEETVSGVGEIKLIEEGGKTVSSKQCSKGQKHEKAPWVCYLLKDELRQFDVETEGTLQVFDKSGELILEDEMEFTSFKIFAETRVRFY